MQCVSSAETLEIFGDFNAPSGKTVGVLIQKCTGHEYCASEEQIEDYMQGKFLIVQVNEVLFNPAIKGNKAVYK